MMVRVECGHIDIVTKVRGKNNQSGSPKAGSRTVRVICGQDAYYLMFALILVR